ncbi:MAG: hypothetical protein F6J93_00265 [Oscillatoria sp. SIO1A7]|nr:hypothetical protein [Oscillatoria sp. SIO1A7]
MSLRRAGERIQNKASRCKIYKKQGGTTPSFLPGANSRVGAIAPQRRAFARRAIARRAIARELARKLGATIAHYVVTFPDFQAN